MALLPLVVLLLLGGPVPGQRAAGADDSGAELVTVRLLADSDAGFGAAATSELRGRILSKHPYGLVLEINPDPESTWTGVLEFAGRDIAGIDGVPFAEVPNTSPGDRTWVLTRRLAAVHAAGAVVADGAARGERVIGGRVASHLRGLEVRPDDAPPERFTWLEVRGVDGLETEEWLRRRGEGGLATSLLHPRTRWLDPRVHADARRLRFLWSDDSFTVLLFLLAVAACAVTAAGGAARTLARLDAERRPPSYERACLATSAACALGLVTLAAGSWLDGGRPGLEVATLACAGVACAAGYAGVAGVRGRALAAQLGAAGIAAAGIILVAHWWGLTALERWMTR